MGEVARQTTRDGFAAQLPAAPSVMISMAVAGVAPNGTHILL